MNRPLVGTGIALVIIGVALFFYVMFVTANPVQDVAPFTAPQDASLFAQTSRLWAVLAGICAALGAALVGIGMNRWRQGGAP